MPAGVVALIGCGRTGSLVAVSLARLGVDRLVLIDPDIVEPHNLGEMEAVSDADVGCLKAEAVARHLHALHPQTSSSALVASITDPATLAAARSCAVLVCCADNDAARLATAVLATLYHKVLLDISTGVFHAASAAQRRMGADVRLILPGDGCLLCRGSLVDYAGAVEALCTGSLLIRPGN